MESEKENGRKVEEQKEECIVLSKILVIISHMGHQRN